MKKINLEKTIKLKTGFFKKEPYLLILGDKEIILRPDQNQQSDEFRINNSSVKTIYILNDKQQEIEIITETESFVGNFIDGDDISEIIVNLKMIFDEKFSCL